MLKRLYRFLNPKFQTLFLEYPVDMRPRYGHGKPPHQGLYDAVNEYRSQYAALLTEAVQHRFEFESIPFNATDAIQPHWNNGFFPGLDVVMLFTLLGKYRPKRYLEVGSGNSTKVAAWAKTHFKLATHITSVDPMPRAEIDSLADTIVRKPFEACDLKTFTELEAGDVLFIDNSHRMLPNSDVTVFFLDVLPVLKPGVIVHIHDIYLPYDYPQFMCDRFYSEQYPLAMCLLSAPSRYKPLMPNYFVSEDAELAALLEPIWEQPGLEQVERHGGSFWITIGEG